MNEAILNHRNKSAFKKLFSALIKNFETLLLLTISFLAFIFSMFGYVNLEVLLGIIVGLMMLISVNLLKSSMKEEDQIETLKEVRNLLVKESTAEIINVSEHS